MPYDAIIVGSGFGAAAAAVGLVEAGMNTLMLERGRPAKRDSLDWDQRRILVDKRYSSPSPIRVRQYGQRAYTTQHPNEVLGGMSVFYGGASLRLRERDFRHWPIAYADLEPYYCAAEEALGVHGTAGLDPCGPPRSKPYPHPAPEFALPAKRIRDAGEGLGLRPFPIPLAINFTDSKRALCIRCNTCDGFPCKIEAKNDVTATLLQRAQRSGLEIITGAIVARLESRGDAVTTAVCIDTESGQERHFEGSLFGLAAGALASPAILQRSGLCSTATGDAVGHFLMRHCNAVVTGIFPFFTNPEQVFHKQLCFTDYYSDADEDGPAAGIIQDIYTPGAPVIRHFAPFGVKSLAGRLTRYMQNLLCVAEDEPRYENRVGTSREVDRFGIPMTTVDHAYSQADIDRRQYLIKHTRRILKAAGAMATRVYEIDTFSHAIGTIRFGASASDSALDESCRFREFENLFVLDGSFMPTSGGVNPSLTIAANALRVADHMVGRG